MNDLARTQPAAADSTERGRTTDGTRIFTGNLFRVRDGRGWAFTEQPPPSPPAQVRRPARVAQALALAHRLHAAIDRGEFRDYADMARALGFTRARVTQIMDLLLLAPDIQEDLLLLPLAERRDPITLHELRYVMQTPVWAEQRRRWAEIRSTLPADGVPPVAPASPPASGDEAPNGPDRTPAATLPPGFRAGVSAASPSPKSPKMVLDTPSLPRPTIRNS